MKSEQMYYNPFVSQALTRFKFMSMSLYR